MFPGILRRVDWGIIRGVSEGRTVISYRVENKKTLLFLFEVVHSVNFLYQNRRLVTRTKCIVLINTNIKGTSPKCFLANIPSSRRNKCQFKKHQSLQESCYL